jgi:2-polyprenyl-6-methoxyphenol hydroxylase-like FAD-dependent oxidoreductase
MAPNRAQGINMALRDAIAVTNHLVPCDRPSLDPTQLATVLARIQATRQPEIHATQHLQLEEWQKIGLLTASPFTYYPFTVAATLFGRSPLIQAAWLRQQQGLRHGTTAIALQV